MCGTCEPLQFSRFEILGDLNRTWRVPIKDSEGDLCFWELNTGLQVRKYDCQSGNLVGTKPIFITLEQGVANPDLILKAGAHDLIRGVFQGIAPFDGECFKERTLPNLNDRCYYGTGEPEAKLGQAHLRPISSQRCDKCQQEPTPTSLEATFPFPLELCTDCYPLGGGGSVRVETLSITDPSPTLARNHRLGTNVAVEPTESACYFATPTRFAQFGIRSYVTGNCSGTETLHIGQVYLEAMAEDHSWRVTLKAWDQQAGRWLDPSTLVRSVGFVTFCGQADHDEYLSCSESIWRNLAIHLEPAYGQPVPDMPPLWTPDQPSRGLGDTVAKFTSALGIKPCGGCKERQGKLNDWWPYKGK